MLPFILLLGAETLRNQDISWMVDNTAALGGTVKGASKEPTLETLIALLLDPILQTTIVDLGRVR